MPDQDADPFFVQVRNNSLGPPSGSLRRADRRVTPATLTGVSGRPTSASALETSRRQEAACRIQLVDQLIDSASDFKLGVFVGDLSEQGQRFAIENGFDVDEAPARAPARKSPNRIVRDVAP